MTTWTAEQMQLIVDNQRLVHQVAAQLKRRLPPAVDVEELVADGQFGLLDAARGFDPARKVPFTTFARPRILGAMLDGIRRRDHLSRGMRRAGALVALVSIDGPADPEARGLRHVVAARPGTAEIPSLEERDSFARLIRPLRRIERAILWGLFVSGMTNREVGRCVGRCESRVSQLAAGAVRKLRVRHGGGGS